MELVSTLSKQEVGKSLREVVNRSRKNVPFPKYICTPTSEQLQQRVPVLLSSNPALIQLINATKVHGQIPELENRRSPKELRNAFVYTNGEAEVPKLSLLRRLEVRKIRLQWLADAEHANFWSHMLFGVNKIMRLLEASNTETISVSDEPKLVCILLDGGWLASPLGHHLARLCSTLGVRLASVKPLGSLASMFSTSFRTLKKAIAVGICLSSHAPTELARWFDKISTAIPLLTHSTQTVKCSNPSPTRAKKRGSHTIDVAEENGEPWSQYEPDASQLYVYHTEDVEHTQLPSERIITLSQLWSYVSSSRSAFDSLPEYSTADPLASWNAPQTSEALNFQPAVLKTMKPQSDAERQSRKKKRKKVKKSTAVTVTN